MGNKVESKEVITYLLTLQEYHETADKSSFDFLSYFHDMQSDTTMLMRHFKDKFQGKGNRAANWILNNPTNLNWELCKLQLANVQLRKSNFSESIKKQFPRYPTVKEVGDYILSNKEQLDETLVPFMPVPGLPEFFETVTVGDEDKSHWRLGDGYHRSVSLYIQGRKTIEAYACRGLFK